MNFKWFGPLALLAALVIGDQIRINRPAPQISPDGRGRDAGGAQIGLRRGGGPSRSQLQPPRPDPHCGRCRFRRSRAGQEPRRAAGAYRQDKLELDGINYVALARLYGGSGGKRVSFNEMSRQTGIVPVKGALIPVLVDLRRSGQSRHRAGGAAGRCRSGARQGLSPPGDHRRSGAERILAARFRRRAGRARHARNRGEIAVAERCRRLRRPRRFGRPVCPVSTGSTPGRLSRENSRAGPAACARADIDPPRPSQALSSAIMAQPRRSLHRTMTAEFLR